MTRFKKSVVMLCVASMMVTALSGCNKAKETSETNNDISNVAVMTENTLPISKEPITLEVWSVNRSQGYVKSYNDFEAFKKIEEKTGVHLEFIHPVGAEEEQLNIMLASEDYPDIMYNYWASDLGKRVASSGAAVILNDYIEKLAPNFKKTVLENEDYFKQYAAFGEDFYFFPIIRDDVTFSQYNGYFIRQDWLDKVGLSVPTNIEQWEEVLKAFKNSDLNGNGKADEIPFSAYKPGEVYRDAFASAFGIPTFGYFLDAKTGKITHSLLTDEFKEYMKTMSRWYKEGLINKSYINTTTSQLDSMMLNDTLGSAYMDNNNSLPKYLLANEDIKLVAAPYPTDKNSKQYHPSNGSIATVVGMGSIITKNCKYVTEAVRYMDYLYTKEASDFMYWGEEGVSYTVDSDGEYKYTDLILNNPDGKAPYEAICKYMTNVGWTGLHQYKSMLGLESKLEDRIKKVKTQSVQFSLNTDKSLLLPGTLPTTSDEDKQLAKITADLDTYLMEMYDKFLIGTEPIENLDTFVATAKELGLMDVIKIKQTAYDRIEELISARK